jgi:hypothetical protein
MASTASGISRENTVLDWLLIQASGCSSARGFNPPWKGGKPIERDLNQQRIGTVSIMILEIDCAAMCGDEN